MSKALQTMEWMTPGANLNAYIQGTATVPILSIEEEKSLGEALYYEDDLDAARRLVMSHLRFVVHIARSYNGYGLPLADLIQEGNVGLMKAVRRFNPEKGVRVVSFAVHWSRPRFTNLSCATGALSKSLLPSPSASCSSICAAPKSSCSG